MRVRAEQEFDLEMVRGSARLQREIGYNPTRFIQMVSDHGGVGGGPTTSRRKRRIRRIHDTLGEGAT
jgi:hypothetical protein